MLLYFIILVTITENSSRFLTCKLLESKFWTDEFLDKSRGSQTKFPLYFHFSNHLCFVACGLPTVIFFGSAPSMSRKLEKGQVLCLHRLHFYLLNLFCGVGSLFFLLLFVYFISSHCCTCCSNSNCQPMSSNV